MRSSKHRSTPSNAFSSSFLAQIGERDEPPTVGEADVAGPWFIEKIPGKATECSAPAKEPPGDTARRQSSPTAGWPSLPPPCSPAPAATGSSP